MSAFAKFTARRINALSGRKGPFWQEGFYDHALRDEEALIGWMSYMYRNPVRAGLVDEAFLWPFRGGPGV